MKPDPNLLGKNDPAVDLLKVAWRAASSLALSVAGAFVLGAIAKALWLMARLGWELVPW